ncbi:MAG: transcription termination/antitermination factor NusG [Clostridia bacterium]|nr:transcription termination/antitermination factor NusG [Clostridia bacterium]
MRWYVIHTYSTYENKVKQYLESKMENSDLGRMVSKIVIPMVEETVYKDGKEKTELKKAFPGYVLIKMCYTKESWYTVRNTPGVTGFVGPDPMNPTPLTPEEVRALNVDIDDISDEIYVDAFNPGDRISIISGPLAGNEGTVEAVLAEKKCVKANVSMFGRKISAELEYTQIELADD